METPSAPTAPPQIETFDRNYIAHLPFLVSIGNIAYIWYRQPWSKLGNYDPVTPAQFVACLSILSFIHVFYTIAFLLAPRFFYRGMVWLKAVPWIISAVGLYTIFFLVEAPTSFKYQYCIIGALFQIVHYVICVKQEETAVSFLFKPFVKKMIPNLLAKMDLSDPNARLDTIYGPPVTIPSGISGQRPTVIRYGSQAIRIDHQTPVHVQQPQTTESAGVISTPSPLHTPIEMPPSYAPPVYEAPQNSSEKVSQTFTNDNSQYDVKK